MRVLTVLLCGAKRVPSGATSPRRGNWRRVWTQNSNEYVTVSWGASPDLSGSQEERLNDALASGDAGYVTHALGTIARARGMKDVAGEAGVSRETLYRALSGNDDSRLTPLY
jgi:probable addiction module antidote protein